MRRLYRPVELSDSRRKTAGRLFPAALRFLSCIASCRPSSRTRLPARGYAREPNDLLRGKSAPVIEKGGAFQVVTAQIPTAKNMAATARKKAIICSAFFP